MEAGYNACFSEKRRVVLGFVLSMVRKVFVICENFNSSQRKLENVFTFEAGVYVWSKPITCS